MGVLRAARTLNLTIPQELALVGFEDVIYNEYLNPSLSVVSQPWEQVGCLVVEMLTTRIRANPEGSVYIEPQCRVLSGNLIIRDSSRAAR